MTAAGLEIQWSEVNHTPSRGGTKLSGFCNSQKTGTSTLFVTLNGICCRLGAQVCRMPDLCLAVCILIMNAEQTTGGLLQAEKRLRWHPRCNVVTLLAGTPERFGQSPAIAMSSPGQIGSWRAVWERPLGDPTSCPVQLNNAYLGPLQQSPRPSLIHGSVGPHRTKPKCPAAFRKSAFEHCFVPCSAFATVGSRQPQPRTRRDAGRRARSA